MRRGGGGGRGGGLFSGGHVIGILSYDPFSEENKLKPPPPCVSCEKRKVVVVVVVVVQRQGLPHSGHFHWVFVVILETTPTRFWGLILWKK